MLKVTEEKNHPDEFLCCITRELMTNPVVDEFGHTYEKESIETWIAKSGGISPMTGQRYRKKDFAPNLQLKKIIEMYKKGENIPIKELPQLLAKLDDKFNILKSDVDALFAKITPHDSTTTVLTSYSNPNLPSYLFWARNTNLSTDKQLAIQDKLIDACLAGNVVLMRNLVMTGAKYDLSSTKEILPLSAAIWGLNLKAVKEVIKAVKPDPAYIKNCLEFNAKTFGSFVPQFKLITELNLVDFENQYFTKNGREAIFSDWNIQQISNPYYAWVKVVRERNFCIYTRGGVKTEFKIENKKLSTLVNSSEAEIWKTFLNQYIQCENAVKNMCEYLNLYMSDTPISYTHFENCIRIESSGMHGIQKKELINKFLKHIVRGEQDEAEAMLKLDASLIHAKTDIQDPAGRLFKQITGFQYSVWALDWYMWKMLLKYLPEKEVKLQLEEQESITEQCGHGKHYDPSQLSQALKTYVNFYLNNQHDELPKQLWGEVAYWQKMATAALANEYCRHDRNFREATFTEQTLPRVLKKNDWNGDWWSAKYNGKLLGEDRSGLQGWAIHRGWAIGGPGPWEGGPPTGCITPETAKVDQAAVEKFAKIRLEQRDQLKNNFAEQLVKRIKV